MKLLRLLFVSMIIYAMPVMAQKDTLSLDECIVGRYTDYYPSYMSNLQWVKGSDRYYSVKEKGAQVVKDSRTMKVHKSYDLNYFNQLSEELAEMKRLPYIEWLSPTALKFKYKGKEFHILNDEIDFIIDLPKGMEDSFLSKDNSKLACSYKNNVWILTDKEKVAVTDFKQNGIVCGKTVHRNEFGIDRGLFWSPSSDKLAFYKKDESMVADYTLVDMMQEPQKTVITKYPMAGHKSHHVQVGVYNLNSKTTTYLMTDGDPEHYLTNVTWSPDGKYIYLAEVNRDQSELHWNKYNVATGEKLSTLISEKDDKYIEPLHPLFFLKKNQDNFIRWTRKDGFFHLYLYNKEGQLLKQLTKGEWEVTSFYGVDSKDRYAYFQATKESPMARNVYRVNLKTLKIDKLDSDTMGWHAPKFNANFTQMIDVYERHDIPRKVVLTTIGGNKKPKVMLKAEDTLAKKNIGEESVFTIKAADNTTDLYCRMIKPLDFDPNKKYPVVVYVYGGPHAQLVQDRWHYSTRWWQFYMAQQGYIAFTLDNRGSANRGKDFEQVIHRNLGINETADQMKGVDYLKSLSYVDPTRIGVHGWSFGGFMTMNLMFRHPDVFKVGVSGGGVVDWNLYEVMYGERYMDTPQQNPEGYKECNMTNHLKDLKGKLLLIHGAMDSTVVMQHSYKMLRKAIKEGKQLDYFVYPTAPHNVRGKDRIHLMRKVSDYFIDNL
ncbi:S9 family peptidase [Halosquirtibacter xylanolyticus]|uniref:S9 family peptidase n=1 Tax=Halosquirtibacter xylanolyticus TaxID=3374599 RepID=UPI0037488F35|nr:S9 family peptidase [Prolixibacteraceae bacterium]